MSENLVSLFDFANAVKDSLQQKYPTANIDISKVIKNNNESLLGITIREHDNNVAPNIYINDYYDAYMDKKVTVDEVVICVQKVYKSACDSKTMIGVDTSIFQDKDKLLDKVIFRLLGKENNEEFLKDAVYRTVIQDLAVVLYVYVDSNETGIMTAKLQQKYLDFLNINEDELFKFAYANTAKYFPAKVGTMMETINEIAGCEMFPESIPMYVISNEANINGASVCLYPGVLKDFCIKFGLEKIIILPSSVHEIIVIPEKIGKDVDDLKQMVEEVIDTILDEKDVLSNSVYLYDSTIDKISKIL